MDLLPTELLPIDIGDTTSLVDVSLSSGILAIATAEETIVYDLEQRELQRLPLGRRESGIAAVAVGVFSFSKSAVTIAEATIDGEVYIHTLERDLIGSETVDECDISTLTYTLDDFPTSVVFSPNVSMLAVGTTRGVVYILSTVSESILASLEPPDLASNGSQDALVASRHMCFIGDAIILTLSPNRKSYLVWNLARHQLCYKSFTQHSQIDGLFSLVPNGTKEVPMVAVAFHDASLHLINLDNPESPHTVREVSCLDFLHKAMLNREKEIQESRQQQQQSNHIVIGATQVPPRRIQPQPSSIPAVPSLLPHSAGIVLALTVNTLVQKGAQAQAMARSTLQVEMTSGQSNCFQGIKYHEDTRASILDAASLTLITPLLFLHAPLAALDPTSARGTLVVDIMGEEVGDNVIGESPWIERADVDGEWAVVVAEIGGKREPFAIRLSPASRTDETTTETLGGDYAVAPQACIEGAEQITGAIVVDLNVRGTKSNKLKVAQAFKKAQKDSKPKGGGVPATFHSNVKSSGYGKEGGQRGMFSPTFVSRTGQGKKAKSSAPSVSSIKYPLDAGLPTKQYGRTLDMGDVVVHVEYSYDGEMFSAATKGGLLRLYKNVVRNIASEKEPAPLATLSVPGPMQSVVWGSKSRSVLFATRNTVGVFGGLAEGASAAARQRPLLTLDTTNLSPSGKEKVPQAISCAFLAYRDTLGLVALGSSLVSVAMRVRDLKPSDLKRHEEQSEWRVLDRVHVGAQTIVHGAAMNQVQSPYAFLACSSRALEVWDVSVGKRVLLLGEAHSRAQIRLATCGCGVFSNVTSDAYNLFASAAPGAKMGQVKVWDIRCAGVQGAARVIDGLDARAGAVGIRFSPCMRYLLAGSEGSRPTFFSIGEGRVVDRLGIHPQATCDVALHPAKPFGCSGGLDGVVRFFHD